MDTILQVEQVQICLSLCNKMDRHLVEAVHYGESTSQNLVWVLSRRYFNIGGKGSQWRSGIIKRADHHYSKHY